MKHTIVFLFSDRLYVNLFFTTIGWQQPCIFHWLPLSLYQHFESLLYFQSLPLSDIHLLFIKLRHNMLLWLFPHPIEHLLLDLYFFNYNLGQISYIFILYCWQSLSIDGNFASSWHHITIWHHNVIILTQFVELFNKVTWYLTFLIFIALVYYKTWMK